MVKAYCMKCKAKRELTGLKHVKMANGRPAMKGKCSKCGANMFKIGTE